LTQIETDFIEERTSFDTVLKAIVLISQKQHGINTDGRGVRAVKIFTRQTLTGLSLDKILPSQNFIEDYKEDFWDISSIASLSRNILEGFLSLHFFGLEKVSSNEAELRFFIWQLHRNKEWYNIRKEDNHEDPELEYFKKGIPEQKERIKNHPFLKELSKAQQEKALKGHEIYKTKADFENELNVCKDLRKNYRLLSNLVHPLPLSVERVVNEKGRGLRNEFDMYYSLISMMLARSYLAASTVGIVDLFSDSLEHEFQNEIDSIRILVYKGFEK